MNSRLQVLAPEKLEISSIPFMNIPNTPPQGIEAELVDVVSGSEDELQARDVRGKVILAESSYSPPRQEKIRLATAKGVIGALIAHWGLEEPRLMVRGNAKAIWGNPTPETMEQMPKIPVLGITKADLSLLRQLLARGSVRVRLTAQVDRGWEKLLLPMGRIAGLGDDAEQFIILGGHYDAWGNGATDNANGNALVLEVARVFNKYRHRLNRGLWICFWSGHETGTMAASTWLIDNFWDELRDRCLAYFNVDSPGMKGTDRYTVYVSPELADFAANVAGEVLAENPDIQRVPHTGDQSFFGIGIPSMNARTMFSPAEIQKMANATLGWWNHGYPCHDTLDKVDPRMMAKNMRAVAATAYEICSRPLLPMSFFRMADEMVARLEELNAAVKDLLRLAPLIAAARRFRFQAQKLESVRRDLEEQSTKVGTFIDLDGKEQVRRVNQLLIRLSRILTHAFASVAGQYNYDPYGLSHLRTRFPGLYYAPRLAKLDPDSEAYHLLLTQCIRERNRAADALQDALHSIDVVFGE
ncbi:MAG: M20/M25/M40 family metallo-hydrolase [Deltaproteobacteria bacterium]|nr:M20/M25/M40 family metallo-hydrolase [Deltaproteobacteria bacterium]